MARFESRLATSSDISALYDLLNEYVIEEDFGEEFTNSQQNFREHFNQGLFKAVVTEVLDDTKNEREIIGCAFLSFGYNYVAGRSFYLNCCYINPAYTDRGLEQELIKQSKKVASDENIHFILMTVNGNDVTYRSALQAEKGMNMTTIPKGAGDFWFMSNPSSTPDLSSDDYVIRKATSKDLGGVYPLLQKLIEFEEIEEFRTVTQEEFERAGEVDKDLYGTVILEHRCRVDDQDEGMKYRHDIVGCVLYTNMYHALKGKTYFIQGLYVLPHLKGKGLGKALVRGALKACKDRHGDGFIFMILHDNVVSQSLFRSLQGTNMTKSKHNIEPYLLRF